MPKNLRILNLQPVRCRDRHSHAFLTAIASLKLRQQAGVLSCHIILGQHSAAILLISQAVTLRNYQFCATLQCTLTEAEAALGGQCQIIFKSTGCHTSCSTDSKQAPLLKPNEAPCEEANSAGRSPLPTAERMVHLRIQPLSFALF